MTNTDSSLMQLFAETDELEIFESESIQAMIQYKWDSYGKKHHLN